MHIAKRNVQFTDTSGTPGNGTANTPMGKSAIALGATAATITNSHVTATSVVHITPMSIDANAARYRYSVTGGSFTVTVDTATAAAWSFTWEVVGAN